MTTKVAVYGSLLSGLHNHHVMEMAEGRFIEETIISGIKIYDRGCGFPFAKLTDEESAVKVEIYEVDDHNLHVLDRLEGYDPSRPDQYNMYKRVVLGDYSIYIYNSPITKLFKHIKSGDWRKFYEENES